MTGYKKKKGTLYLTNGPLIKNIDLQNSNKRKTLNQYIKNAEEELELWKEE